MPPRTRMMRKRRAANRSCRRSPPGRSDKTVVLTKTSTTRPRTKLLSSGGFQARASGERGVRVGGGDERPSEVAQREAVTRRLGGRPALQLLVQVPVHPLVAVEEAQDVAPRAKRDVLGKPREV